MRIGQRLVSLAARPHLPRRTVRLRLTLLYSALFLVSGAVLLTITYFLVRNATSGPVTFRGPNGEIITLDKRDRPEKGSAPDAAEVPGTEISGSANPDVTPAQARQLEAQARQQHDAVLDELLTQSGIALGVMAVLSIALGWLVAGRVLRPLRTMTATTRQISEHNLHERLDVQGPRDELKDLGDTIDGLLTRVEGAFDAQRRFVANASHELRTPLTLERTMLQVALADPHLTLHSLRATCEDVLAADEQQEHLIEALLMLARSQRGLDHRELFDLAAIGRDVLHAHEPDAVASGLTLGAVLSPAPVSGDARLTERLVSNLVENAVRYNIPNGTVQMEIGSSTGRPVLRITNTGPAVPADQVERLLQPFQRLATDRGTEHDGLGLGLSIVTAIADAHGATVTAEPFSDGGLDIEVIFPAPSAPQPGPSVYPSKARRLQPAATDTA
jgi:signal transduction histidine kinase